MKQNSAVKRLNASRTRRQHIREVKTQRAARRPPRGIDELLYQVGLIPADAVLRDLFEVYKIVLAAHPVPRVAAGRGQRVQIPAGIEWEEALDKALAICLEGHDELSEYIRNRNQDDKRPLGAPWYWYVFIRESREKLRKLVKGESVSSVGGPITTDHDGIFHVERDRFAEALDGFDSHYLRECALADCRRIFFATRINQPYCCKKHGNVARNRQLRAKRAEGYYQGAKLTRKEKKELAERKTKRAKTARER
jgi:hypothetical protein